MPRLSNSLRLEAYKVSPLLPLVLQGARIWELAVNELRWLKEYNQLSFPANSCPRRAKMHLLGMCRLRARGKPLQYILRSQPFGTLDIKCRPGVLIPRPETEAYTTHLASIINEHPWFRQHFAENLLPFQRALKTPPKPPNPLKIADLGSGSGCISLLLYSLLAANYPRLDIRGYDISAQAIAVANENLQKGLLDGHLRPLSEEPLSRVKFYKRDILSHGILAGHKDDILISNPPYISPEKFNSETARSVRNWEPKLALVPPHTPSLGSESGVGSSSSTPGDFFYNAILSECQKTLGNSRRKIVVMEVGDDEQAVRVVKRALAMANIAQEYDIQIWRDWPSQSPAEGEASVVDVDGRQITVEGSGNMRAIVLFRKRWGGFNSKLQGENLVIKHNSGLKATIPMTKEILDIAAVHGEEVPAHSTRLTIHRHLSSSFKIRKIVPEKGDGEVRVVGLTTMKPFEIRRVGVKVRKPGKLVQKVIGDRVQMVGNTQKRASENGVGEEDDKQGEVFAKWKLEGKKVRWAYSPMGTAATVKVTGQETTGSHSAEQTTTKIESQ